MLRWGSIGPVVEESSDDGGAGQAQCCTAFGVAAELASQELVGSAIQRRPSRRGRFLSRSCGRGAGRRCRRVGRCPQRRRGWFEHATVVAVGAVDWPPDRNPVAVRRDRPLQPHLARSVAFGDLSARMTGSSTRSSVDASPGIKTRPSRRPVDGHLPVRVLSPLGRVGRDPEEPPSGPLASGHRCHRQAPIVRLPPSHVADSQARGRGQSS